MSAILESEVDLPESSHDAPPDHTEAPKRRDSKILRLVGGLFRQAQLVFTTQLVERIILKRQKERLFLVLGGHIFFQTLSAAVQLDLFSWLHKQKRRSRSQIMEHFQIDEKPARILLLGCTALGLLRKTGDEYSNSWLADKLFVKDAPGNLIPVVLWQHHINYRSMWSFFDAIESNTNMGLAEFLGEERTLYGRLAHDRRLEKIFQDAMETISVQANQMLAKFVDLSNVRHLVDVGGGNGTNAMALASKYANLRATVFDSASVCKIADENIEASGLGHRVHTHAGDCFADAFPQDADCFLFSHFFTIWSEERNRLLLNKTFSALPPGGRVIVFNMMQHDSGTGPLSAAMGSPYFLTLATGEGMLYTWAEYEKWMKEAGFSSVKRLTLPKDHGAIIGIKS